jgi:hypothetical protein
MIAVARVTDAHAGMAAPTGIIAADMNPTTRRGKLSAFVVM